MKRRYEGIIVLNTKGKEETPEALFEAVSRELEEEGAMIGDVEHLGRREFAYNARHLEAGHYVKFGFEADPGVVASARVRLKLNETVFLQHYQRLS